MGNHMACMSPAALKRLQQAPSDCTQNLIRFLHCETGAVSEVEGPLTAAEVMMEFPAQFLSCLSNVVSSGRRICAVPADEELRAAELYVLLPMHKLNTRFSGEEMAFFANLEAAAKNSGKQSSGSRGISQSRVAPYPAELSSRESSKAEGAVGPTSMRSLSFKQMEAPESMMNLEGPASLYRMGAAKNMMCRSKSWIPKLQTITESS